MGLKRGGRTSEPLRAVLREVDVEAGRVVRDLPWESPPDRVASGAEHCELTGLWRDGDDLWCTTRTEVLRIGLSRWQVEQTWSHPLLYDVHSIQPTPDGDLILSLAGNESVAVFSRDGELRWHWYLGEGAFSDRYAGVDDFRRLSFEAFKPHTHHPNFAFFVGGEPFVTVFRAQVCRSLRDPSRRIGFPEGPPHDGRAIDGRLWFTCVSGYLIAVDPVTLQRTRTLDLNAICDRPEMLGWCRGVEVVGDRLFVGMTMLRAGEGRELLRRLLAGRRGEKLPTRIVEIDLATERVVREVPIGNRAGGTVYGLAVA